MLERIRNQITELRKEEERRYTYEAEFSFSKELPVQYSEWMNTIWDISNRDKIKIYLVSEGGESFDLKENVEEEYAEFLKGLESDETVEVSLTIDKKIVNGYLSVYCFEKFAEDISSLPIDKVLTAFSNFMKKAGRSITFEGISDVIDKMTENVEFADRFMNKNGSLRKTPLKKKRAISKLEFFIPEYEYRRLKKMKDPIETLERPVEHMTVYRNDGSSVTLTAENGRVSIVDSREKNVRHIIEADYFVSKIL